jgi:hypothetical protein
LNIETGLVTSTTWAVPTCLWSNINLREGHWVAQKPEPWDTHNTDPLSTGQQVDMFIWFYMLSP